MRKKTLFALALAALPGTVYAPDLTGDWQGTLRAPRRDLRIVLRITKTERGTWNATLFSIDQNIQGVPTRSVTLKGSRFKFEVEPVNGSYQGKITVYWLRVCQPSEFVWKPQLAWGRVISGELD